MKSSSTDASNREILEKTLEQKEELDAKTRSQRFKMFFAGLSFAVLSFIGAHPIEAHCFILKFSETIALFSLLGAGIILLLRLENYSGPFENLNSNEQLEYKKNLYQKILFFIFLKEKSYWWCFITGMGLALTNRSIVLFIH